MKLKILHCDILMIKNLLHKKLQKIVCPICFTKHNNYNDYLPLEENEWFPMMIEIDYDD